MMIANTNYLYVSVMIEFNEIVLFNAYKVNLYQYCNQQMTYLRFLSAQTQNILQQKEALMGTSSLLDLHKTILPYLLSFTVNMGVFFTIYQYRRYSIILHALICSICMFFTLITSLSQLIEYQISSNGFARTHAIIGVIVIVLILIQITCGIISKIIQCTTSSSFGIFIFNRIHKCNGYFLLILGKIEIYLSLWNAKDQVELWPLLASDVLLLMMFGFRRGSMKEMQSMSLPVGQKEELLLVETLDNFGKAEMIGVFANYVFNIEPLLRFHPMGFSIIESVRGREFDRFLFGSSPTERLPAIPPNNHSLRSIDLLGPPLAKIHILPLYDNLEQDMREVKIKQMVQISPKGGLFQVRLLQVNGKGFRCRGYSSIHQIGRYFVLNLDEKVSRLYITVSFLAPRNIELLQRLYFQPNNISIYSIAMNPFSYKKISENNQDNAITTERQLRNQEKEDYLPLYIKKYPGGLLTTRLIEQNFSKLQLSTQRGQGLRLHRLTAGKVVVFIGGTGIIPFGDLIDLLFKAILIQTHPQYKQLIVQQNPILGKDTFKGFSFKFYLEEHYYEDIHPLTRAQLIEVTKYPQLLQFHLKCHQKVDDARLKRSNIKFVNEEMQEMVREELSSEGREDVTQYWVCCSPTMSAKLIAIFDQKQVPEHKFVFL